MMMMMASVPAHMCTWAGTVGIQLAQGKYHMTSSQATLLNSNSQEPNLQHHPSSAQENTINDPILPCLKGLQCAAS